MKLTINDVDMDYYPKGKTIVYEDSMISDDWDYMFQHLSEEVHKKWFDYFGTCEMDFVGEAHCKVGTQYYPKCGKLAEGEEKKIWEEVIELGHQYHEL